jgi:hypothetical protein
MFKKLVLAVAVVLVSANAWGQVKTDLAGARASGRIHIVDTGVWSGSTYRLITQSSTQTTLSGQLTGTGLISVISSSAADTTAVGSDSLGVRVWGAASNGTRKEAFYALKGTTVSTRADSFYAVEGVEMSATGVAAGTVRVKYGNNGFQIASIPAGQVASMRGNLFAYTNTGQLYIDRVEIRPVDDEKFTVELREYPQIASVRSPGSGYRIMDTIIARSITGANMSTIVSEYPRGLKVERGGWVGAFVSGSGTDTDLSFSLDWHVK